MAKIDYIAIAADLEAKIRKAVKSCKMTYKEIVSISELHKNEYFIQVDFSEPNNMCDVIADVIRKHKYGVVISEEQHVGFFDWQADIYIKDSACVTYGVK